VILDEALRRPGVGLMQGKQRQRDRRVRPAARTADPAHGRSGRRSPAGGRVAFPPPPPDRAWPDEVSDNAQRETLRVAYSYAMASLAAAFGDNPLGLVPDVSSRDGGIRLLGVLHGGPAHYAGLREGDRIIEAEGKPYISVTQRITLPARLLVEQRNARKEVRVEARSPGQ